jgi:hypothetical protein
MAAQEATDTSMALQIGNLKGNHGYSCAECRVPLPDWGYKCDICAQYACAACFQRREIREKHEHQQPDPQQLLLQGAVADAQLALDPALDGNTGDPQLHCSADANSNAAPVPKKYPDPPADTATHCPSCGWKRTASSLDTKLRFLQANKRALDWYELNQISASGKDAHCVMSQSAIREVTLVFLQRNVKDPCSAIEAQAWPRVCQDYKAMLTVAAFAPPPEPAKPLARFGTPEQNQARETQIRDAWKPPAEIVLTDDKLPVSFATLLQRYTGDGSNAKNAANLTVNGAPADLAGALDAQSCPGDQALLHFDLKGQGVDLPVKILRQNTSEKQKTKRGDFLSKFPKELREPAETLIDGNGLVTVRVKVKSADGVDGDFTIFTRTIERDGTTASDKYQDFRGGQPVGQEVSGTKSPQKPAKKPFPENVFSNLMRAELMEGNQCAYCEDLQGAFTLPQRVALFEQGGLPPEFVGLHLLKKIEDAGGIRQFMDEWLNRVVNELQKDLTRLCEEAKAEAAKAKAPAKQPAEKKAAATEAEIEQAVADAIAAMGQEFTSLAVTIAAGKILAAQNKAGDNDSMKARVKAQLQALVDQKLLVAGPAAKGVIPYTRSQHQ